MPLVSRPPPTCPPIFFKILCTTGLGIIAPLLVLIVRGKWAIIFPLLFDSLDYPKRTPFESDHNSRKSGDTACYQVHIPWGERVFEHSWEDQYCKETNILHVLLSAPSSICTKYDRQWRDAIYIPVLLCFGLKVRPILCQKKCNTHGKML